MNRQVHDRGEPDGRERKLKSLPMGVQISCGVYSEMSATNAYKALRNHLGEVFQRLASQQESRIIEGHLMPDHVHMLIAIPPKYAVSQVIGFIKGKSAIHLARVYGEKKRNFVGQHFWARGYFVSTVGRDETMIRDYIRHQEQEDQRIEQMNLWN